MFSKRIVWVMRKLVWGFFALKWHFTDTLPTVYTEWIGEKKTCEMFLIRTKNALKAYQRWARYQRLYFIKLYLIDFFHFHD